MPAFSLVKFKKFYKRKGHSNVWLCSMAVATSYFFRVLSRGIRHNNKSVFYY